MLAAVLLLAVMPLAAGDRPPAVHLALDVEPAIPVERSVAPARPETCPGFVRELLKLDATASLSCAPGRFPDDGYFVRAFYRTSELWERVAVVAADGSRLLVPPEDQPSRLQRDGDSACLVEILRAFSEHVPYPRCADRKVDDLVSVTGGAPTR